MFYSRKSCLLVKVSSDGASDMSVNKISAVSNGIGQKRASDLGLQKGLSGGQGSHLQNLGLNLVYLEGSCAL